MSRRLPSHNDPLPSYGAGRLEPLLGREVMPNAAWDPYL